MFGYQTDETCVHARSTTTDPQVHSNVSANCFSKWLEEAPLLCNMAFHVPYLLFVTRTPSVAILLECFFGVDKCQRLPHSWTRAPTILSSKAIPPRLTVSPQRRKSRSLRQRREALLGRRRRRPRLKSPPRTLGFSDRGTVRRVPWCRQATVRQQPITAMNAKWTTTERRLTR